jgi:hypothetical protein
MAIEAAIWTTLHGHSGLHALTGDRIYPGIAPEGAAVPYVTYRRVSGPREHAMGHDPGLASPRFQVDAWDDDYDGARAVADEVIDALQDWSGTVGTVVVNRSILEGDQDNYDAETERWQIAVDFIIWHRE